uniref:Uncharacterized protein n=1 Tax=Arion vulgaris TaxID=1028688 RepID=A0A0B7BV13_9EUPU
MLILISHLLLDSHIPLCYEEAKTIAKGHYKAKWDKEHPKHNKDDGYYQLSRRDQTVIVRI